MTVEHGGRTELSLRDEGVAHPRKAVPAGTAVRSVGGGAQVEGGSEERRNIIPADDLTSISRGPAWHERGVGQKSGVVTTAQAINSGRVG